MPTERITRRTTACNFCKHKKQRCIGGPICSRCKEKKIKCDYPKPKKRGPPRNAEYIRPPFSRFPSNSSYNNEAHAPNSFISNVEGLWSGETPNPVPIITNPIPIFTNPIPIVHNHPIPIINNHPLPIVNNHPLPVVNNHSLPVVNNPIPIAHNPIPIVNNPAPVVHSPIPIVHNPIPIINNPISGVNNSIPINPQQPFDQIIQTNNNKNNIVYSQPYSAETYEDKPRNPYPYSHYSYANALDFSPTVMITRESIEEQINNFIHYQRNNDS